VLLLYAIAIGLLIGRLAGGRVHNLERVDIAWWGLALGGLIVQVVLFASPVDGWIGAAGTPIYVVSTLVVLAALLRNILQPGFPLIAVGAFANLVVVLANGGAMPSDPHAWMAISGEAEVPITGYSNVVPMGPDTNFAFLGDIFVLPPPIPLANVFSVGDLLIGIGAGWFIIRAMRQTSGGALPATSAVPATASR
jgi:Family of unknown function (DUF5317)